MSRRDALKGLAAAAAASAAVMACGKETADAAKAPPAG
ncbi:MAG: twin-arginine translocation signal domain-containing protein, partial [Burkholderiales bacterium]